MLRLTKLLSLYTLLLSGISLNIEAQERQQLFDFNWKFKLGNAPEASAKDFNDQDWRTLDLPHDWSIEGKISPENPMGGDGGFFPSGIAWYRKTFNVPANWKGKLVSINFEGVYMNSEVFINGKSLGVYPYGYSAFTYDLTPYLHFGKENVVAVRVDNAKQKNSRWYSGSGIYRHVWIKIINPIHVPDYGVSITTPQVSPAKALVQVKTKVKNDASVMKIVVVRTHIMGPYSKETAAHQVSVKLAPHSEQEFLQQIAVVKPKLWSIAQPHLYQAKTEIWSDQKLMDSNTENFGIRDIKFSTTNGFQLNGKTIKLNGGCVHHDNGCLGAAAFDRAEVRRVELLKAAGFNAIRTAHNPPSAAFLSACDHLGMLVIDEAFDGWKTAKNKYDYAMYFDKWWEKDVAAMVLRDRNHPSIIMWSIGNEIIERKEAQAVQTAKMLAGKVRQLDPTRPVTSAMTTWDKDWEIFDPLMAEHDIAGYNYQLHRAIDDHKRVPSRIIVQTESYPRDAFANWKLVNGNNYILGDFVWTAMDYLGESGIGRWYYAGEAANFHSSAELFPWHGAYCGDIDLLGYRKPISHYRSMLYNDTEKLYVAVKEPNLAPLEIKETDWSVWPTWESWTWPGYEGKNIAVEVYSKYPKVRLYLNKKLIGEKETTEQQEFKAVFTLPYATGELSVAGVQDGKEVEHKILKTAGKASTVKVFSDRNRITANGQDLAFVTVEVTDSNGVFQPNAENRLHFVVEGPGTIVGVDNANLKDTDPYLGNSRKAWKGRALVVIRTTNKAGNIKLKVSSADLASGEIILKSNK